MAIISLNTNTTGLIGNQCEPRRVTIVSTDTLATVEAAGYLNGAMTEGYNILPTDVIDMIYGYNVLTKAGTFNIFTPSFGAGGIITLAAQMISTSSTGGQVITTAVTSATPGTVRALVGSISNTATTMTSGNIVGIRGVASIVGASGGFIYGTQGKVIVTGTLSGSEWTAGVFGQLDISAATINAGQIAPIWGDYGTSSGTLTNATGMYGIAMTNTTAAVLEGQLYLYGGATNLLYLNTNAGESGTTYFKAAGTSSGSAGYASGCNATEVLVISVNGTTYYLPAFAQNT